MALGSNRSGAMQYLRGAQPKERLAPLQFVLGYTGEEFAASLDHIAEGRIDVTPLITGHIGLEGVKGAFAQLADPEQPAKVVVEPWS